MRPSVVDPHWRMRNLYCITDKDGRECLFRPWPEQEKLLGELWYRNLILKARQRGFSTLIQLLMLDTCLFNANVQAAVIAQDQDAATAIFRGPGSSNSVLVLNFGVAVTQQNDSGVRIALDRSDGLPSGLSRSAQEEVERRLNWPTPSPKHSRSGPTHRGASCMHFPHRRRSKMNLALLGATLRLDAQGR